MKQLCGENDIQRRPRLRLGRFVIVVVLAWYDLWIGIFFDRNNRRIYILPFPCIGFYVQLSNNSAHNEDAR